jgi:small subunit ribosomal protein S20
LPNTKSAAKNLRKSKRRRARNQVVNGRARTAVKKARILIEAGQMEEAREAVRVAQSSLDKAAQKGVIHKMNAARRKARLNQMLNKALQAQK